MSRVSSTVLIAVTLAHLFAQSVCYIDGARSDSCYDHNVDHGSAVVVVPCTPPVCPYFLIIREVVNEATLELGIATDAYECGKVYGGEKIHILHAFMPACIIYCYSCGIAVYMRGHTNLLTIWCSYLYSPSGYYSQRS